MLSTIGERSRRRLRGAKLEDVIVAKPRPPQSSMLHEGKTLLPPEKFTRWSTRTCHEVEALFAPPSKVALAMGSDRQMGIRMDDGRRRPESPVWCSTSVVSSMKICANLPRIMVARVVVELAVPVLSNRPGQ